MKQRTLLLLALTLLLIAACEKDKESYDYPIELIAGEIEVTTPVRMFVQSGEVQDQAVINAYLENVRSDYFHLGGSFVPLESRDTIIYLANDAIEVTHGSGRQNRVPVRRDGIIYFYMTDTVTTLIPFFYGTALFSVYENIGIYTPYYRIMNQPLPGNPVQTMEYYDALLAKGNPEMLEFPLISFYVSRTRPDSYDHLAMSNYNNIFSESVVDALGSVDTLLVQESRMIYMAVE